MHYFRLVNPLGVFTVSYYLYLNGKYLIKRSRDAESAATDEVEVAALLSVLPIQEWEISYNIYLYDKLVQKEI